MKKIIQIVFAAMLTVVITACADGNQTGQTKEFDVNKEITVVSREEGSGTRGAFVELMKIEEKSADGSKVDHTTKEAIIANKTDVVLTNISNDLYAIGYISLGSLNDRVKFLRVNGVIPNSETVKNGSYPVARPFNLAWKGEASALAKDFITFVLSAEGQEIVAKSYTKVDDASKAYAGNPVEGKLVIAGSSSVTPIIEKLVEAYQLVNGKAKLEVQMSDSSAGMTAAINGTADIGMASRELKVTEKEVLTSLPIAMDGIAIIVNEKNPVTDISSDQIKAIFVGDATTWSEIVK